MTHPEGSLAGYVDGSLPASERAAVDAHLGGCARCRDEVALARGARTALAALPTEAPPPDVADRALEEAGIVRSRRATGASPHGYRIAGITAAAAAIVLLIAVALPHVGQRSGTPTDRRNAEDAGGAGANPAALAASEGVEIEHTNYDTASLTALTASYASQAAGAAASPTMATARPKIGGPQQTQRALTCIVRSAPDQTGTLTRLIKARFAGTPAYLTVFLDGPGAGQPPDTVAVWVLGTSDCAILSFSSARL